MNAHENLTKDCLLRTVLLRHCIGQNLVAMSLGSGLANVLYADHDPRPVAAGLALPKFVKTCRYVIQAVWLSSIGGARISAVAGCHARKSMPRRAGHADERGWMMCSMKMGGR